MSRKALETIAENDFNVISEYYANGSKEELPEMYVRILDRWRAVDRILKKFPAKAIAARKLQAAYPDITLRQAFLDINNACKFWNIVNPIDRAFLLRWLIDNLMTNLASPFVPEAIKAKDRATLAKIAIEIEHEELDPKLMEKSTVNIQFNINSQSVFLSEKELNKIPKEIREKILMLTSGEITEDQAAEIINS